MLRNLERIVDARANVSVDGGRMQFCTLGAAKHVIGVLRANTCAPRQRVPRLVPRANRLRLVLWGLSHRASDGRLARSAHHNQWRNSRFADDSRLVAYSPWRCHSGGIHPGDDVPFGDAARPLRRANCANRSHAINRIAPPRSNRKVLNDPHEPHRPA